jgi:hypothetical protein
MPNVATAQEDNGGKAVPMGELLDIVRSYDASKCPPNMDCTGVIAALGIVTGVDVMLRAIIDGLNLAGTHGCNGDFCFTLVRLIDRDLGHFNELLSRAKKIFNEEKMNSEEIDFIFNDASQLVSEVYHYYPLVIDLLTRYGRGGP